MTRSITRTTPKPERRNESAGPAAAPARLRTVAGTLLVTALVAAPLAFGSTRRAPWLALIALVSLGGLVWLASGLPARTWRLPPVSARLGAALVALVAIAWLLFLAPPDVPVFTLKHYARIAARWPQSVVPRSLPMVVAWAGAAILALFAFHDLASDPVWRRVITGAIVVTGAVVALLGLVQNATHAPGIYWSGSRPTPGAFFATFFHHTAAGAYLNTVWPLGLAGALLLARDPGPPRLAVLGSLACGLLVLAAHAGHISRFPQVIAGVVLGAFALWIGPTRSLARFPAARLAFGVIAAGLALGLFALGAGRVRVIQARWAELNWAGLRGGGLAEAPPPPAAWPRLMRDDLFIPSDHRAYPLGDRGAAYATAAAAIADRPWFGWGPGGWMAAAAAHSADPFIRTFFLMLQFTHEDYLQTGVEWGLIGALGWALLVPGAWVHALARLGRRPERDLIGAGAVAALAAVLIQSLIDFPLQIPAVQFNVVALAALAWSVPAAPLPA